MILHSGGLAMLNILDVSTSGLVAQRARLNAISGNIANMSTTHNEKGEPVPYQPKFVVFKTDETVAPGSGAPGVKIESVNQANMPPRLKYMPNHPDANAQGYVAYPNIDMTTQFVDALEASRAYEANIGVMEITKNLAKESLRIIA
jgi:flagellar basal-body rod protein FlgC